jgi:hypothetical protein
VSRLQYTAGVSYFVLEHPSRHIPHLKGSWLINFRQSLSSLKESLQVSGLSIDPLQREHYFYIMVVALAHESFSSRKLRLISYCRLYLQALTVANICTGDDIV